MAVDAIDDGQRVGGMRRPEPDAHGQAALVLAESTLHLLVETGVLTRGQAVDAVQTAGSVKREWAEEAGEANATMNRSLSLLRQIERSIATIGEA